MIRNRDIFKPSDHLTWKILDDRTVVADEQEGKLFHFNGTGAAIWNALDGKKDLRQIIQAIRSRFDSSPARLEKDIKKFVDHLFQMELVQKIEKME